MRHASAKVSVHAKDLQRRSACLCLKGALLLTGAGGQDLQAAGGHTDTPSANTGDTICEVQSASLLNVCSGH